MLCVKTIYRDSETGQDKESCGFFCEHYHLASYLAAMDRDVAVNIYEAPSRQDGSYPNNYKKETGFQGVTLGFPPIDHSRF